MPAESETEIYHDTHLQVGLPRLVQNPMLQSIPCDKSLGANCLVLLQGMMG